MSDGGAKRVAPCYSGHHLARRRHGTPGHGRDPSKPPTVGTLGAPRLRVTSGSLLFLALAAVFGVHLLDAPWVSLVAGLVVVLGLRGRLSLGVRIAGVGLALCAAWRADHAVRGYVAERARVRTELAGSARCVAEGVVESSPVERAHQTVVILTVLELDCDRQRILGPLRIRVTAERADLLRGQQVRVTADLGPIAATRNFELPDPVFSLARRGVVASGKALVLEVLPQRAGWSGLIDRARNHARRRIEATYSPAAAPLGRALVLGENDLDPEDQEAFRRSGLAHLLAVSGTHLVFAVVSVMHGLRAVLVRIPYLSASRNVARGIAPVGLVLALLYADFAGGSGSALRAAWMLAATYLASACGRRISGVRALAISLGIGAATDSLVAFDISFLLSAAASAGLILIGPRLRPLYDRISFRPLSLLIAALCTTVSAMLPCTPLLLVLSPELTVAGMVANVVAGPIGEVAALPLCLVHAIASPLPWLEQGLALSGSGALVLLGQLAHMSAACRSLSFPLPPPTSVHVLVLIVGTVGWMVLSGSPVVAAHGRSKSLGLWLAVCGTSLIIAEVGAVQAARPKGILRITVVDVGQGDALLVDLPDGRLMLIDGGGALGAGPDPGRTILLPILRARRRNRIDVLVLTHPHPDHYGGLLALLPTIEVGEFWDGGGEPQSPGAVPSGPVAALRQTLREQQVPRVEPRDLCGKTRWFGTARVDVLSPCPPFPPMDSANDASIVLRIGFGGRVALLPGDAEQGTEGLLVNRYGLLLRADLLKAGHHGSRTSTSTPFLEAVRPTSVAVSVGFRNRFGHPHPSLLARLSEASIIPTRTDEVGAIEWSTDGNVVSERTAALFSNSETAGQVSRQVQRVYGSVNFWQ